MTDLFPWLKLEDDTDEKPNENLDKGPDAKLDEKPDDVLDAKPIPAERPDEKPDTGVRDNISEVPAWGQQVISAINTLKGDIDDKAKGEENQGRRGVFKAAEAKRKRAEENRRRRSGVRIFKD